MLDRRGRLKTDYISGAFRKLLDKHGMQHITFHDLRHSCLTILANSNGCTIRQVQAYAGHANYNITVNLSKGHTPQSSHIRQRALPFRRGNAFYYRLLFETKLYELNLPERTKSTLYRGGCSTIGQLVSLTPTQLKKIRNLGKKTYKDIVDMLKEYGLRLKDEDTTPTGGH